MTCASLRINRWRAGLCAAACLAALPANAAFLGAKRSTRWRHHGLVRAVHRAGRRHRRVLARARAAREDRREAPPSADATRSRRCACCRSCSAACCGRSPGCGPTRSPSLTARLRHRQARGLLRGDGKAPRRAAAGRDWRATAAPICDRRGRDAWQRRTHARNRRNAGELTALRDQLAALEPRIAALVAAATQPRRRRRAKWKSSFSASIRSSSG